MTKLVHILSILILVIGFSSCQKTELDGFDQNEVLLKKHIEVEAEILEEQKERPSSLVRSGSDDEDVDEDDTITDDEDDEDEDENNPSAEK